MSHLNYVAVKEKYKKNTRKIIFNDLYIIHDNYVKKWW